MKENVYLRMIFINNKYILGVSLCLDRKMIFVRCAKIYETYAERMLIGLCAYGG